MPSHTSQCGRITRLQFGTRLNKLGGKQLQPKMQFLGFELEEPLNPKAIPDYAIADTPTDSIRKQITPSKVLKQISPLPEKFVATHKLVFY